ncbi:non-specific lipid transfer protein GPI-anchored 1 [Neltuma alba]|uniref:non-specific lipid transfer protein GPI-anchored 1 n=1 Tax=Neltuma alba TaxID=207710 RepID=UPI0010A46F0B|nr:non-specific lipid transfer protein GPI-anchored 1 [Prosopis alba]
MSHSPPINAQDPSFSNPSIAQCTSSLLPLVPCAPFVQGISASPGQPCCDNLELLYAQVPRCLCVLQNVSSTLTSFPINRTLALQLPARCTLQVNVSDCPGVKLPTNSPPTQASNGTMGSPTVAASPIVPVTPKPSVIGFGLARSEAINLKAGDGLTRIACRLGGFVYSLDAGSPSVQKQRCGNLS